MLRQHQVRRLKRSLSDPVVVHMVTDTDQDTYSYTDTGLEPFSEYRYGIRASNSEGFTQSPWTTIYTQQSSPETVLSPVVSYIEAHIDSLNIKWTPPEKPNGIIQSYQLQRNTSVPLSFTVNDVMEYTDTNLLPFTMYSYKVIKMFVPAIG